MEALGIAAAGAVGGSLLTAAAPRVFGVARTGIPRVLGFVKLTYVRTAAGGLCGLFAATAVALSTSDHSHKPVTYVLWYGLAGLALFLAIGLTVIIDRRSEPNDSAEQSPASRTMNPLLRALQQQNKGARRERETTRAPLTDEERTAKAGRISARAVQRASDDMLRALDPDDEEDEPEPAKPEWTPPPSPPSRPGAHLAGLLKDAEAIVGEPKRQIERGEDLLKAVNIAHAEKSVAFGASMLAEGFVLDRLTIAAENWAKEIGGDPSDVPKPPDKRPTGADFARLSGYIEGRIRELRAIS